MSRLIYNGSVNGKRRVRILPYNMGSQACKTMSKELGQLRLTTGTNSRFTARERDTIINWGFSGTVPERLRNVGSWVNHPTNVRIASNKLTCFEALSRAGIPVPSFTTNKYLAENWLNGENLEDDADGVPCDIVCRHRLQGHSGEGVEIIDRQVRQNSLVETDSDYLNSDFKTLPSAPLYVKYIPKKFEYRVHVLPGGSTSIRQKLRDTSVDDEHIDWRIRSHGNGFIFAKSLKYEPEGIKEIAEKAVDSLGLEFGAVDIIYNEKRNQMYVLEINTAPGLEGSTVGEYVDAFKNYLKLSC